VLDSIASTDATEVVLADSYHVATLDNDAPTIFAGSVEFARRLHAQRVGDPA
jgi:carboxylesterase